jgi:HlyD family secretion protein
MKNDKLSQLRIDPEQKARPKRSSTLIFLVVALLTGAAIYFSIPREGDNTRLFQGTHTVEAKASTKQSPSTNKPPAPAAPRVDTGDNVVLTVSGYVIPRERIELSPRFMGMVKWIGVKKGDAVTNDQVVVLLDDSEYRARQRESEGRLASAHAALKKAELQYERVKALATASIESRQMEDDMRLNVEAAAALVREIEGQLQGIQNYLDWCTIRSPIDGVVLEKLVDPNELVTPQSFGGTRGPSTALISVADLQDLQVEIDLNEADVAKVTVGQKCNVSPEAYPDKVYEGVVAEKAPEANRQKGTLQVKVQILNPDRYLTPELTAKVDFLKTEP